MNISSKSRELTKGFCGLVTQGSRCFAQNAGTAQRGETGGPQMPKLTHVKRFYKKVDVIEHPLSDQAEIVTPDQVTLHNLSKSDSYFAVALDGRVTKTLYKDDLIIPTRAMAIALAEEWDMQGERVDLKSLVLNQMLAKAVRTQHDDSLQKWQKDQLLGYLIDDEICYQSDPDSQNDYEQKLALEQSREYQFLFDFMQSTFGIKLQVMQHLGASQDPSALTITEHLNKMDPWALNSLHQISQTSKSTSLALASIYMDGTSSDSGDKDNFSEKLSLEKMTYLARLSEKRQQSFYGVVDGAHDFDHVNTLTTLATARQIVSLCRLREF